MLDTGMYGLCCNKVLCHVMLDHVVLGHAMLDHVVLGHVMLDHVVLGYRYFIHLLRLWIIQKIDIVLASVVQYLQKMLAAHISFQ